MEWWDHFVEKVSDHALPIIREITRRQDIRRHEMKILKDTFQNLMNGLYYKARKEKMLKKCIFRPIGTLGKLIYLSRQKVSNESLNCK